MPIKKGAPHGLWKILVQKVGSSGLSYGQAGSSLANGSISQAYVLNYPREASFGIPDPTDIDFSGGDRWIGSYQYGIANMPAFDFSIQDEDDDFNALITSSLVDSTSNSQWNESTPNELLSNRPQLSIAFIYRLQSFEAATFGQTYYRTRVIPRCWISPKKYALSYQSPQNNAFRVKPTSSGRKINGVAFGANLSAEGNTLMSYDIVSDYPLYMFVMRANGTTASAVSAYKPVTSAVGTTSNSKNLIVKYVESTNTATVGVADTVTVATGTFAIGTALTPASSDMLAILHETEYVAV